MKHTTRLFGLLFLLAIIFGSVHAQDPELRQAVDSTDPLLARAAGLVPQSGEGAEIRSAFNENVDRVRLMVMLSPT